MAYNPYQCNDRRLCLFQIIHIVTYKFCSNLETYLEWRMYVYLYKNGEIVSKSPKKKIALPGDELRKLLLKYNKIKFSCHFFYHFIYLPKQKHFYYLQIIIHFLCGLKQNPTRYQIGFNAETINVMTVKLTGPQ